MAGRAGSSRRSRSLRWMQAGLLEFAVRSLSSQMKSVRDLRRKMKTRAEPEEAGEAAMDAVIVKLKELGYLSDERFAADYTRLRKENEKYGKRRVQQGLMQKGIAQELTQSTLATAYDEVDEVALAKEYVARKRMKKPEGDKEVGARDAAADGGGVFYEDDLEGAAGVGRGGGRSGCG